MRNKKRKKAASDIAPKISVFTGESERSMCEKCAVCEGCSPRCSQFDLCQKRVFIVGGVERMERLYREIVEGNGGFLDYHSGSMQGGIKRLEKCLYRADLIICPLNCNSHGACIRVKNMAKKFGKELYLLPTGSVSSIRRVLQENYGYA